MALSDDEAVLMNEALGAAIARAALSGQALVDVAGAIASHAGQLPPELLDRLAVILKAHNECDAKAGPVIVRYLNHLRDLRLGARLIPGSHVRQ